MAELRGVITWKCRLAGRVGRGPELGDVDPAHEGDIRLAKGVLDEVPQRRSAAGLAAPAGVHADGHQPAAEAAPRFLEQVIQSEPETSAEMPRPGIGRRAQEPPALMALVLRHAT